MLCRCLEFITVQRHSPTFVGDWNLLLRISLEPLSRRIRGYISVALQAMTLTTFSKCL